jgi:biotin carboxylase
MARKLESEDELDAFLARPAVREFATDFVAIFNRIVAKLTPFEVDGSHFLAEGFLRGLQVTVEGYEHAGQIEILGVVDSIMYPGTGSFARFDYPSVRRAEIQERMADVTRRVARALGLRQTLFNLELIYEPASDSIQIIEMNPRLCGQFADLYAKVDGTSSYEVALALACGEEPHRRRHEGRWKCATSFPLRVFEPVRVLSAPDAARIAEVEARHPDALIWWECAAGDELSDFEHLEDGNSFRYGVVNLGADSRAGLLAKLGQVQEDLGCHFESIPDRR